MDKIKQQLIEEYNKVLNLQSNAPSEERWETLMHYGNGLRFAIDLLDKESDGESIDG